MTRQCNVQANFTPRTDPTAEDRWTAAEEPLAWAHSRVASYNPAQRLFKCTECECVGFLARVAEHWLGTHSQARAFQCPLAGCGFAASWARNVRAHLARDHHSDPAAADHLLRDNPALLDLTRYLQRLKSKVSFGTSRSGPTLHFSFNFSCLVFNDSAGLASADFVLRQNINY